MRTPILILFVIMKIFTVAWTKQLVTMMALQPMTQDVYSLMEFVILVSTVKSLTTIQIMTVFAIQMKFLAAQIRLHLIITLKQPTMMARVLMLMKDVQTKLHVIIQ